MKLNKVQIVNFRSIEDQEITLDIPCRILVGINESGKTNILKALNLLSPSCNPTKDDIREPLPDENQILESSVSFIFKLDEKEQREVAEKIKSLILSENLLETVLFKSKDKFNIDQLCTIRNEGLYEIDLLALDKTYKYWTIDKTYSIEPKWKMVNDKCPPEYVVKNKQGNDISLKKYSLVNFEDYPQIEPTYLENATPESVNEMIGNKIIEIVKAKLPKTIYWLYDEKNLLPPSVDINQFIANPDICVPLKNMFILGGITDIAKAINDAKQGTRNSLINLLHGVAKKTTAHFRNVWKEYKQIDFGLDPDGTNIIPSIIEKNRYDFSKRSDGFKRFVSFLLLISANVKSNLLTDTMLLIDEPDISLHPSGARFLREELLNISKKNYVVYSTHSIFMIDDRNISRHLIVKKTEEKTEIIKATDSNIVDEEVLFNALGYSVFETLNQENIIFEGWKDKKLFEVALQKASSTIKKRFQKVGICHAKGVKHVRNITPILELAHRKCVILSDADDPAKEKQKEYSELKGYGKWLRYDELNSGINITTAEDFIDWDVVKKILQSSSKKLTINNFDETKYSLSKGVIYAINLWLVAEGISDVDKKKQIIEDIKNEIFEKLKVADIKTEYYTLLSNLSNNL